MVVFSDRPITEMKNLYGKGHRKAVKQGFFAAVLGARRVRTSVVKTLLNHYLSVLSS